MADLSVADISQLYSDSIVLYRGRPVRVMNVERDKSLKLLFLTSMKYGRVPFNAVDFKPYQGRVGFINQNGHAFYVVRNPARRFSVGLTRNNTAIYDICVNKRESEVAYGKAQSMNTTAWSDALLNVYPSLKEALTQVKANGGSCAFDKQFAVDSMRRIFFKKQLVGYIPSRMSSKKRIIFNPEYQFLEILVENHYDKTVRTFEAA